MIKQLLNKKPFVGKTILAIIALIIFSFGACQKKEEQPIPKSPIQSPMVTQPSDLSQPMSPHGSMMKKEQKTVLVPGEVKKSWGKVKIVFTDKEAKTAKEYTVTLGSEFEIPGSSLKVAVGEFLPDFKMNESNFTSTSNEPKNPAVRVEIFEKGQSIFKGWLYAKYPEIHPFEHGKYGLVLKEGLKR